MRTVLQVQELLSGAERGIGVQQHWHPPSEGYFEGPERIAELKGSRVQENTLVFRTCFTLRASGGRREPLLSHGILEKDKNKAKVVKMSSQEWINDVNLIRLLNNSNNVRMVN